MSELLAAKLMRTIPDFPQPGILFRDITPVLLNPSASSELIEKMTDYLKPFNPDLVVGIESRGFMFGMPVALNLGVGFAPIRKLGKLPAEKITEEYALEYGTNSVEIHTDAIKPGQKVVIIDDLLATGGTAAAAARLTERLGGKVECILFFIELEALQGRKNLVGYNVHAFLEY